MATSIPGAAGGDNRKKRLRSPDGAGGGRKKKLMWSPFITGEDKGKETEVKKEDDYIKSTFEHVSHSLEALQSTVEIQSHEIISLRGKLRDLQCFVLSSRRQYHRPDPKASIPSPSSVDNATKHSRWVRPSSLVADVHYCDLAEKPIRESPLSGDEKILRTQEFTAALIAGEKMVEDKVKAIAVGRDQVIQTVFDDPQRLEEVKGQLKVRDFDVLAQATSSGESANNNDMIIGEEYDSDDDLYSYFPLPVNAQNPNLPKAAVGSSSTAILGDPLNSLTSPPIDAQTGVISTSSRKLSQTLPPESPRNEQKAQRVPTTPSNEPEASPLQYKNNPISKANAKLTLSTMSKLTNFSALGSPPPVDSSQESVIPPGDPVVRARKATYQALQQQQARETSASNTDYDDDDDLDIIFPTSSATPRVGPLMRPMKGGMAADTSGSRMAAAVRAAGGKAKEKKVAEKAKKQEKKVADNTRNKAAGVKPSAFVPPHPQPARVAPMSERQAPIVIEDSEPSASIVTPRRKRSKPRNTPKATTMPDTTPRALQLTTDSDTTLPPSTPPAAASEEPVPAMMALSRPRRDKAAHKNLNIDGLAHEAFQLSDNEANAIVIPSDADTQQYDGSTPKGRGTSKAKARGTNPVQRKGLTPAKGNGVTVVEPVSTPKKGSVAEAIANSPGLFPMFYKDNWDSPSPKKKVPPPLRRPGPSKSQA